MKGNRIIGTGAGYPSRIMTNEDLSKLVDTTDEWIVSRTGIRERRIAEDGETTSDFAATAALNACEMAGIDPMELDLIILATLSPDMLIPSTACMVQDKIGAKNAACFDLEAACSGFVYGITVADAMMPDSGIKHALVIGAETLSRVIDWSDRNTCVLFADGAGAAILRNEGGERGVMSTYIKADGSAPAPWLMVSPGVAFQVPKSEQRDSHFAIRMEGKEVFKFGVRALPDAVRNAAERAGIGIEDLDIIIPHQANIRIIDAGARALGIDKEKFFVNLDKFGNTSAGTIPLALDQANREGRINEGDLVALAGFGAGLTWAGSVIRW